MLYYYKFYPLFINKLLSKIDKYQSGISLFEIKKMYFLIILLIKGEYL